MPSGKRRYEVQLQSKTGPIDVFLIQDSKQQGECAVRTEAPSPFLEQSENDLLLRHFDLTSDHYPFDLKGQTNDFAFNDVFDNVFNI